MTRGGVPAPARAVPSALLALVVAVGISACASTGQVAPRTLTVEISRAPASVLAVNIYIVPVRSGGASPAGDPIMLGAMRPRDLGSFEFDTDRMGGYRLYATSGEVRVIAGRIQLNVEGRDDAVSRTFYIEPDTERIIWDLATDRLLVR